MKNACQSMVLRLQSGCVFRIKQPVLIKKTIEQIHQFDNFFLIKACILYKVFVLSTHQIGACVHLHAKNAKQGCRVFCLKGLTIGTIQLVSSHHAPSP